MFKLLELPYSPDALDPVISVQTLSFHHRKHLQAYVDNLNKLLPGSGLEDLPLEEIVVKASTGLQASSLPASTGDLKAIFNNAGQVLNHNMYFTQFAKIPSLPAPTGNLVGQIEKQWGSLDAFKTEFEAKGVGLFGSGWVWLSAQSDGTLVITQEQNAGNPVTRVISGQTGHLRPILTFDVWEHAYYLDYQNRRAAHLHALWNILDWKVIEERYE